MSNNNINDAFGMNPMPMVPKKSTDLVIFTGEDSAAKEAESDIQKARANMHEMIDTGIGAIEELSRLAVSSQHPRSFEVLNQMIKTVADISESLVRLHESKKKITGEDTTKKNEDSGTTVNNLFVGSTAELQKYLAERNNQ